MTGFLVAAAVAIMLLNVGLLVRMLLVLEELIDAARLNAETQYEMELAAKAVAADLAARYVRADATEGVPGEAADVAARSDPDKP